ncbi:restriction endonuclease subunit S [Roseibium polysiphoniae]|uniref:restriction endonuclease subunit S n=1 Tax=Roseibium polysiphoniae TaxID=2571221 RepID=UPI003297878A
MTSLSKAIGGEKRVIGGPFGSKLTQRDYVATGIPVIRGGNMQHAGRWIGGDFAYVSQEKYMRDLKSNTARPGDIIVTQRGTLGQVSIVPENGKHADYVVSQSQMAIRVDEREASRDFVYYFLTSPIFDDYVEKATIQTGVPHINLGILRDVQVDWPDVQTQIAIARVLTSLDDKIELNRRMNKTLEEMARALFRDWFVDFGPTRRQMAMKDKGTATDPAAIMGHAFPAEKAATLAPLFPAKLGDDGLPEGWVRQPVGELSEIVGGGTPNTKTEEFWESGTHLWATPRDLSKLSGVFIGDTERKLTDAGLGKLSSGLSPKGSVLMSSRAPIGYLAIASQPVAVNQGFIVMRPTDRFPTHFAKLWCEANMETIEANANGSTFQEISKKNFKPILATVPTTEVMAAFSDIARLLFDKVQANEQENQTLAEMRDLLLPKLMSGEIRLKDAEAAL